MVLVSVPSRVVIGILTTVQIAYTVYISICIPYDETKSNIIEIFNKFVFLVLLSSLIIYNTEHQWTETVVLNTCNLYIWTMWLILL